MIDRRGGVALLANSGGPSPVINASLLGVVEEAQRRPEINSLLGARFGVDGILAGNFLDLLRAPGDLITAVGHAPSSALGTSRREIGDREIEQILAACKEHNVRYFFYNGGNGSMGTAHNIQQAANAASQDLQVIGIPKTIDNDLLETDHSPGYGSTARFFVCALRDIGLDNRALPGQVEIVEVLGRNAGWIAAATALARATPEDAPHLIYFPEVPLSLERLFSDIYIVFRRLGRCVIAVCEGQLNEMGQPFGADVRSGSRGTLAMNLGHRLAMLVNKEMGLRARSEKPGLLGRSSALSISEVDWKDAYLCGTAAVRAAVSGARGKMVALVRERNAPYESTTRLADLAAVAFQERLFPEEWRSESQNDVRPEFLEYVLPLTGTIQTYPNL